MSKNSSSKKKKLVPIIIIIAVLIVLICVAVIGIIMYKRTGSIFGIQIGKTETVSTEKSEKNDKDNSNKSAKAVLVSGDEAKECTDVVKSFMDAYIGLDPYCAQYMLGSSADSVITFSDVQSELAQGIEYTLGDVYSYGDSYYVEAVITNKDFAVCAEEVNADIGDTASSDEISVEILNSLKTTDARREFNVQIYCYKEFQMFDAEITGSVMRVYMTMDFSNALLGGANEYFGDILDDSYLEIKG